MKLHHVIWEKYYTKNHNSLNIEVSRAPACPVRLSPLLYIGLLQRQKGKVVLNFFRLDLHSTREMRIVSLYTKYNMQMIKYMKYKLQVGPTPRPGFTNRQSRQLPRAAHFWGAAIFSNMNKMSRSNHTGIKNNYVIFHSSNSLWVIKKSWSV